MESITWTVGNVKITSVVEIDAGNVIQKGIPNATKENISKIPWFQSYFADSNGNLKALVQAFVIETQGMRVIIDPCVGNNKARSDLPEWGNLETDFLRRLEHQGYARDVIDVVLCTHLHFDHVGWNTVLVDGKWVPTFSKARYVFVEKEFNYWKGHPAGEVADDRAGFDDSVWPVFEAGLVDLVPEDHVISSEISLIPTPGHTPAHVSVLIKSGVEQAVITGDAIHHPCQIVYPTWEAVYDGDKKQACISRRALLDRFADTRTLIIGTHFSAPTSGYLHREGTGFKFTTV